MDYMHVKLYERMTSSLYLHAILLSNHTLLVLPVIKPPQLVSLSQYKSDKNVTCEVLRYHSDLHHVNIFSCSSETCQKPRVSAIQ